MKNILMNQEVLKEMNQIFKNYISEENFIGVGTCRACYRIDDNLVLKMHLNEIGYKQSKNEEYIYTNPKFNKHTKMLAKPLYCSKEFSVYEYVEPLEQFTDSYDVWCSDEQPFKYSEDEIEDFVELLVKTDEDFDTDDLALSSNIGKTKDGWIVFLDYGFKKSYFKPLFDLIDTIDPDGSLLESIREKKEYSFVETYIKKVLALSKWNEL